MFSALLEMRGGNLSGHSRRVADLCRRLAVKLCIDGKQVQEIFVAALLHEIGKLGFSDELLQTPLALMTPAQLDVYRKHIGQAEQLLMPLADLRGPADIIGAQFERFDGTGFPAKLADKAIPMGARILAVASDYDSLQIGTLAKRRLTAEEARVLIVHSSGKRYDPEVVAAFVALQDEGAKGNVQTEPVKEHNLLSADLQAGMVLSRDLISPTGILMLAANHVLDVRLIHKIRNFERSGKFELTVSVRQDSCVSAEDPASQASDVS